MLFELMLQIARRAYMPFEWCGRREGDAVTYQRRQARESATAITGGVVHPGPSTLVSRLIPLGAPALGDFAVQSCLEFGLHPQENQE